MKTIPATKAAILLAFGILLSDYFDFSLTIPLWGFLLALLVLTLFLARFRAGDLSLMLLWVGLGILIHSGNRLPAIPQNYFERPIYLKAKVINLSYAEAKRRVYVVQPKWISIDSEVKRYPGLRLRLISDSAPKLAPGAVITFSGSLQEYSSQRNPGGRDWRRDFTLQDIAGWIKADTLIVLKAGRPAIFTRLRESLSGVFRSALPKRQAQLLTAMTLGDKSVLPEELSDAFKRSGLYHLLVVSGANIGYLTALASVLITPLIVSLRWRRLILLVLLWCYTGLAGFSPPTVRAALMVSLVLLSYEAQRVPRPWNLWGAAALILLLVDPQQLFQPGFQLSFAAMAGVLFAADLRVRHQLDFPVLPSQSRKITRFLSGNIYWPFITSLCAVVFTAPLLIAHFGGYAPMAILLNLLAIPLSGVVFVLAWLLLLLSFLPDLLLAPLAAGVELLLKSLEYLAQTGSLLPGNANFQYGGFTLAFISLVLFIVFMLIRGGRKRLIVVLIALGAGTLLPAARTSLLEITFFDVGQGETTLFCFPGGNTLLVDCGEEKSVRFELIPALKRCGIRRIHNFVITHFDRDHCGGAKEILKNFSVDRLLVNCLEPEGDLGRSILKTARQHRVCIQALALGDTLDGLPHAKCLVLWPPEKVTGSDNERSIVLRVSYGDTDVLLTGDITQNEERRLAAATPYIESEILKIAHHGSDASSNREFLASLKPQIALIGVGQKNRYGHPAPRVVEDLNELGVKIHRTDLDCAGVWRTDGQDLWSFDGR